MTKNKGGRPLITFTDKDWQTIEEMCKILCSAEEISNVLQISSDTLGRRIKAKHGISFAEYFKKFAAFGKSSLRRNLFKLSEKNAAVAIFLSKNYLGLRDEQAEAKDEGKLARIVDAIKNVK